MKKKKSTEKGIKRVKGSSWGVMPPSCNKRVKKKGEPLFKRGWG